MKTRPTVSLVVVIGLVVLIGGCLFNHKPVPAPPTAEKGPAEAPLPATSKTLKEGMVVDQQTEGGLVIQTIIDEKVMLPAVTRAEPTIAKGHREVLVPGRIGTITPIAPCDANLYDNYMVTWGEAIHVRTTKICVNTGLIGVRTEDFPLEVDCSPTISWKLR